MSYVRNRRWDRGENIPQISQISQISQKQAKRKEQTESQLKPGG